MIDIPRLESRRLILRGIEEPDIPSVLAVTLYDGVFATDPDDARSILRRIAADCARGEAIHWGIFLVGENIAVGTCGFYRGFESSTGEIGYIMKRAYRGRGIMTEAVGMAIRFGLEELGLQHIIAYTDPANQASMAVLRRCGFTLTLKNQGGETSILGTL